MGYTLEMCNVHATVSTGDEFEWERGEHLFYYNDVPINNVNY